MLNLFADSPTRPPDWRWLKVNNYAEVDRVVPRRQRDEVICDAIEFLARLRNMSPIPQVAKFEMLTLMEDFKEIAYAHDIYTDNAANSYRWDIEARILAEEPFDSIAKKTATTEEVIKTYEALFFNVLDRIDSSSWVTNCVIGRSVHAGLSERDFDLLWKLFGYWIGPAAIDVLMKKSGNYSRKKLTDVEKVLGTFKASIENNATVVGAKAYSIMPVNSFTATSIIQIEQAYRALLKEVSSSDNPLNLAQAINNVMSCLPLGTGNVNINQAVLNALRETYDNMPAELRANEVILAANGESFVGLEHTRLPEPEAKDGNE